MGLICFATIQPWRALTTTVGVEQSALVLVSVKHTSWGATDKVMPLLAAHKKTKGNGCSNESKGSNLIDSFSSCREIEKALVKNGPIL
jgi:hypothetical protein